MPYKEETSAQFKATENRQWAHQAQVVTSLLTEAEQKIQPLAVHQSPMTHASALQLSRQWSCTPSIPCVTKRTHLFPHAWSVEYYGNLGVCMRALSLQQRLKRLAQGLKPTIGCENSLYSGKKVFQ